MSTPAASLPSSPWDRLLDDLADHSRMRVQKLFPSGLYPPLFPFLIDTLDRDAAAGRASGLSRTLLETVVLDAISDPAILSVEEAVRLARAAGKLDNCLDSKLLRHLTGPPRNWPVGLNGETARVLHVIDEFSDCRRLIAPLLKFVKLPRQDLRSKAVKLIARGIQSPAWAEHILKDPDPRVRANLVDSIASLRSANIDELLRIAVRDPHHRVSVGALLRLAQRGDEPSAQEIHRIAVDGSEAHRGAAAWALRKLTETKTN